MTRRSVLFLFLLARAAPAAAQPVPDFEREVWPVLRSSCLACHSAAAPHAELRLDSRAGLLKGGVSGPAAVPGKSAESLLVKRLRGEGAPLRMPPGQPLPDATIGVLASWIDAGAPWPEAAAASGAVDFVR